MKRTQKKWLGIGVLSSAVRRGAKHAVFLAALVASASASFGAAKVDASSFAKKMGIVFSGYKGGETLTDFPVLVKLSSAKGFDYSACASGGGDLRFALEDGTLLSHEVDTWDATGISLVWVKVPSFTSTTAIYVYYGYTGSSIPAVSAGDVWSNGFAGVWHLGETALPLLESSGVSTPFSEATGSSVAYNYAGAVGGAVDLYSNGGRYGGLFADDDDDLDGFSNITIECWLRQAMVPDEAISSLIQKVDSDGSQHSYRVTNPDKTTNVNFVLGSTGAAPKAEDTGTSAQAKSHLALQELQTWHHVAFTYAYADRKTATYHDGTNYWSNTGYWNLGGNIFAGSTRLSLGCWTSGARAFAGQIDELRISKVARSADWIKATRDCVADDDFCSFFFFDSTWDDYDRKFTITFPSISGTLENFPVLVRIAKYDQASGTGIVGFDYADCRAEDGGDLRFADANGDLLASEVDTWDTTGTSLVWVKVPSLSSGTKITCYYGSAKPNHVSASDVWDDDYVAVWHLGESALPLRESSGVGPHFTASSGTGINFATSGVVGGAVGMNSSNTKSSVIADDDDDCEGFRSFTFEYWFRPAVSGSESVSWRGLIAKLETGSSERSYRVQSVSNGNIGLYISTNGTSYAIEGLNHLPTPVAGTWGHNAFTYDSSSYTITTWNNGGWYWDSKGFYKLNDPVYSGPGKIYLGAIPNGNFYPGVVDELRISKVARSADWIKATYDTAASASFAAYGAVRSNSKGLCIIVR